MGSLLVEGSEPELREDEAVCEVTGYTYNRRLPHSPWIDPETGRQIL